MVSQRIESKGVRDESVEVGSEIKKSNSAMSL